MCIECTSYSRHATLLYTRVLCLQNPGVITECPCALFFAYVYSFHKTRAQCILCFYFTPSCSKDAEIADFVHVPPPTRNYMPVGPFSHLPKIRGKYSQLQILERAAKQPEPTLPPRTVLYPLQAPTHHKAIHLGAVVDAIRHRQHTYNTQQTRDLPSSGTTTREISPIPPRFYMCKRTKHQE